MALMPRTESSRCLYSIRRMGPSRQAEQSPSIQRVDTRYFQPFANNLSASQGTLGCRFRPRLREVGLFAPTAWIENLRSTGDPRTAAGGRAESIWRFAAPGALRVERFPVPALLSQSCRSADAAAGRAPRKAAGPTSSP